MTAKEIAQGAFASLSTLLRIAAKAKSQRVSTIWFCICLMSYVEKEDFMREDVHFGMRLRKRLRFRNGLTGRTVSFLTVSTAAWDG